MTKPAVDSFCPDCIPCDLHLKQTWFDLAFEEMGEWIEENYPKGNKERGKITVILTRFLLWLMKPTKPSVTRP